MFCLLTVDQYFPLMNGELFQSRAFDTFDTNSKTITTSPVLFKGIYLAFRWLLVLALQTDVHLQQKCTHSAMQRNAKTRLPVQLQITDLASFDSVSDGIETSTLSVYTCTVHIQSTDPRQFSSFQAFLLSPWVLGEISSKSPLGLGRPLEKPSKINNNSLGTSKSKSREVSSIRGKGDALLLLTLLLNTCHTIRPTHTISNIHLTSGDFPVKKQRNLRTKRKYDVIHPYYSTIKVYPINTTFEYRCTKVHTNSLPKQSAGIDYCNVASCRQMS